MNRNQSLFALNNANTYPAVDGQFAFYGYFYFWGDSSGDDAVSGW